MRRSRRFAEEGKKLSKAHIECLDAVGFRWRVKPSFSFDKRIEELRTFKAEFGHCHASPSTFASNEKYKSLGKWCAVVRGRRKSIQEGKEVKSKLSEAQIRTLDEI